MLSGDTLPSAFPPASPGPCCDTGVASPKVSLTSQKVSKVKYGLHWETAGNNSLLSVT